MPVQPLNGIWANLWLSALYICAFVGFSCLLFSANSASAQTVHQYTNTTTATIVDNDCTTGLITRTFSVTPNYIVDDVDLGVRLTHSWRSDLRITLQSPAGTTVNVMLNVGGSGNNLHDRFDDEATANISTHNATVQDPTTPTGTPYWHSFRPSSPLSAIDGQNASGTWTMTICDSVGADEGIFRRADLFITEKPISVAKTSSVVSDGVSGANPKAIPGAEIRYCVLVTNIGTVPTTAVVPTDTLPTIETFVANSMRSGTTCAGATSVEDANNSGGDESDPFGMSIAGTTISGSAPTLAAGASFAMVFNVIVN